MREEIVGEAQAPTPVPCLDTSLTLDAIYRRVALPLGHEPESPVYGISGDEDPAADHQA